MADFEAIFAENQGFIYKYLLKLSQNSALAEELTQETFFRAYMNLSQLRKKEKVSVWLCQIAKNTYFSWYRENKKLQKADSSEFCDIQTDLEDAFVQKEVSGKAFACLHDLQEPYKEVFMLSVLGGLSLKDISALFGKSESWARVTFYRAKQKLMEKLREFL